MTLVEKYLLFRLIYCDNRGSDFLVFEKVYVNSCILVLLQRLGSVTLPHKSDKMNSVLESFTKCKGVLQYYCCVV